MSQESKLTISQFQHDLNNEIVINTIDLSLKTIQDPVFLEAFSHDMKIVREALKNALDEESLLGLEVDDREPMVAPAGEEAYSVDEIIYDYTHRTELTKEYLHKFKERFTETISENASETIKRIVGIVEEKVNETLSTLE